MSPGRRGIRRPGTGEVRCHLVKRGHRRDGSRRRLPDPGGYGRAVAAPVPASDETFVVVSGTRETFARADIVAFERNGFGPVSAGGWESCDWLISGGGVSVAVSWDGRIGAGRDDRIVASGNIRGADYRAMFGMDNEPPEVPIADEEIMSYLMIAIPEVDTAAADFTITVTGRSPGAGEDVTPDIDVIGVRVPVRSALPGWAAPGARHHRRDSTLRTPEGLRILAGHAGCRVEQLTQSRPRRGRRAWLGIAAGAWACRGTTSS